MFSKEERAQDAVKMFALLLALAAFFIIHQKMTFSYLGCALSRSAAADKAEADMFASFNMLIPLSNEFYTLDSLVREKAPSLVILAQLELIKTVVTDKRGKWRGTSFAKSNKPLMRMLKKIDNYVALAFPYFDGKTLSSGQAKAEAVFNGALDDLDAQLSKIEAASIVLPSYWIGAFDRDAVEKYRQMNMGQKEKGYSGYLLFGRKTYNAAMIHAGRGAGRYKARSLVEKLFYTKLTYKMQ